MRGFFADLVRSLKPRAATLNSNKKDSRSLLTWARCAGSLKRWTVTMVSWGKSDHEVAPEELGPNRLHDERLGVVLSSS